MKIVIKEFYGWKRSLAGFVGSLRISFPELGFQILGIKVVYQKNKYFFTLPFLKSYCPKKDVVAHFPLVSFDDKELNKEVITFLRENAPNFILERLKDKENPVLWPDAEKLTMGKKKPLKKSPVKNHAKRVFSDPPKRNFNQKGSGQ